MKPSLRSNSSRAIAIASAVILMAGCTPPKKAPAPTPISKHPTPTSQCPPKYPQHYANAALHYSICLPKNVTKGSVAGLPAGSVEFEGFSVPAGTNLTSKRLIIHPGSEALLQSATPFGQFTTAGGVTLQRVKATDAGAGHQFLNIIYVWKHAGHQLNFVFEHRSVNAGIVGPPEPAVYNEAAQVHITEEIMKTLRFQP